MKLDNKSSIVCMGSKGGCMARQWCHKNPYAKKATPPTNPCESFIEVLDQEKTPDMALQ